jgi:hypothetical protein
LIRTASEKKARRGIERFLSICKGCPEIDANWGDAVRHLAGSLQAFFLKSHKNIDRHIECYLDSLHGQLAAAYGNTQAKKEGIDQLIGQLKEMMQSDRSLRPSMEEALLKLEKTLKCFKQ